MAAGEYPIRFAWAVHSYGTPVAEGDPVDVYAAPVNLWGGYDTDRSGAVVTSLEAESQETRATVRFRNYPAVSPLDTLTDPQTGEVWTVETARRGVNEIVCEVSR